MESVSNMKKIKLEESEIMSMKNEQLLEVWHKQEKYVKFLEEFKNAGEGQTNICVHSINLEIERVKDELEQLKKSKCESSEAAMSPPVATRGTLVDPGINILVNKLNCDIRERESKIDNLTAELNAWKLTSSDGCSVDEKRAMAKCKMLAIENSELGDLNSDMRLSHIKAEVDEQKSAKQEIQQDIQICSNITEELDDDLMTLQGTLMILYQALRTKGKLSPDLLSVLSSSKNSSTVKSTKSLTTSTSHTQQSVTPKIKNSSAGKSVTKSPSCNPTSSEKLSLSLSNKESSSKSQVSSSIGHNTKASPQDVKNENGHGPQPSKRPKLPPSTNENPKPLKSESNLIEDVNESDGKIALTNGYHPYSSSNDTSPVEMKDISAPKSTLSEVLTTNEVSNKHGEGGVVTKKKKSNKKHVNESTINEEPKRESSNSIESSNSLSTRNGGPDVPQPSN